MININDLLRGVDDDCDLNDSERKLATRRLLYSMARQHDRIYTELERLKESTGFNKPFPILLLPREIRNQIYTYSLCATNPVETAPAILFHAYCDT
jgi:hypothetical protein